MLKGIADRHQNTLVEFRIIYVAIVAQKHVYKHVRNKNEALHWNTRSKKHLIF